MLDCHTRILSKLLLAIASVSTCTTLSLYQNSNCFAGDSTSGQTAVYELGMTGIPIYNASVKCSVTEM